MVDSELPKIDRFERAKLLHDYFKFLATLSTGTIAFLVTFSDKFKGEGDALIWFATTLLAFLVCVVSSVAAQTSYIWYASSPGSVYGSKLVYLAGLWGSWISFFIGIFSLVVFALYRLWPTF